MIPSVHAVMHLTRIMASIFLSVCSCCISEIVDVLIYSNARSVNILIVEWSIRQISGINFICADKYFQRFLKNHKFSTSCNVYWPTIVHDTFRLASFIVRMVLSRNQFSQDHFLHFHNLRKICINSHCDFHV